MYNIGDINQGHLGVKIPVDILKNTEKSCYRKTRLL